MSTNDEPCACTSLRKAARAVTRFYEEALAPAGLTATQFAILRALQRRGPTPMSRLAEELVMDRTSLYRALAPLLRHGLAARRASPTDRRAKDAVLTSSGRARIRTALPHWRAAQRAVVERVGGDTWPRTAARLDEITSIVAKLASANR